MRLHLLSSGAIAGAALAGLAWPQAPPAKTAPPQAKSVSSAPAKAGSAVDPETVDALKKMTTYLGALPSFEVRSTTTLDQVLDNGQKLQFDGGATYRIRRPDRLFIEMHTDRQVREFYFDGKTFTMVSPRNKLYAKVDAPKTLGEFVDKLDSDYGISLPLSELFRWGSSEDVKNLNSATHIGYAKVGGVDCDQYAFRQQHVDWQVWIQRGDKPLPRKLVITTRDQPEQPQYVANLAWELAPKLTAASFVYKPPADVAQIKLMPVDLGAVVQKPE